MLRGMHTVDQTHHACGLNAHIRALCAPAGHTVLHTKVHSLWYRDVTGLVRNRICFLAVFIQHILCLSDLTSGYLHSIWPFCDENSVNLYT